MNYKDKAEVISQLDRTPTTSHSLLKVDKRIKYIGDTPNTLSITSYMKGHEGLQAGQLTSQGKDILKTLSTLPKASGTGWAPSRASYEIIDEALTQGLPLAEVRNIAPKDLKLRLETLKNQGAVKKFMDS